MKPYIIPFAIALLLVTTVTFAQEALEPVTEEPTVTEPALEETSNALGEVQSSVLDPKLKEETDKIIASTTLTLDEAIKEKLAIDKNEEITKRLDTIIRLLVKLNAKN